MKVWISQKMADLIREWLHNIRSQIGPQLCCEKNGLNTDEAVTMVLNVIRDWGRELVLCFLFRGSQWRSCLVSLSVLQNILQKAVETEEVVSIIDIVSLGGCTVDFTPDNEGKTVELLLTAWGEHEESARVLAERLGEVNPFRGN
jgi:hypothetical protein